ncbi:MAG: hypothetical protein KBC30_06315 [Planctomycetes bacterium]|nr:hypothetical protein [Planctomycetota bacterium]
MRLILLWGDALGRSCSGELICSGDLLWGEVALGREYACGLFCSGELICSVYLLWGVNLLW